MRPVNHWLCLITSDREYRHVDELTSEVWQHFDGICAVVHKQGGDSGEVKALLESRMKDGFVIEADWMWHHGHSMNHWLLNPKIRPMDCCWLRDSTERFNPIFTARIREFTNHLSNLGIYNIAQYSKLLMFRRWFGQQFIYGIHWGLSGLYRATVPIEQVAGFQNDKDYAYSVRNEVRPADHRYRHEVYYILNYGLNGNHLALFHKDTNELDEAYHRLHAFMEYLDERGVRGVDEFGAWLKELWAREGKLPDEVREWINAERPFRNYFRYYVLGHSNGVILKDEDTWRIT